MAATSAGPGQRPTLLLVTKAQAAHRVLARTLENAGYFVLWSTLLANAASMAAAAAPVIVLIDLDLPDLDGTEGIQRLSTLTVAPLIALSDASSVRKKTAVLDAGADDYIEKPYSLPELLARIRVLLRRTQRGGTSVGLQRIGPIELDRMRRIIRVNGQSVSLTPREWDLLAVLARQPGQVVTQSEILISVWGPKHVRDIQYLRVHISHIRRKLGAASNLLQTEPGVGFRISPFNDES